jgi:hypothetical protein
MVPSRLLHVLVVLTHERHTVIHFNITDQSALGATARGHGHQSVGLLLSGRSSHRIMTESSSCRCSAAYIIVICDGLPEQSQYEALAV